MNVIKEFFIELGFDFDKKLSRPNISFLSGEIGLKEKINSNIFFFESPNQTNTSFYLVTIPLLKTDFDALRKYIWNENKADLLFYVSNFQTDITIDLFYSKASPILNLNECKLDTFKPTENDLEKAKKINCWQFESGSFWLNYHAYLKKTTQKSIDKELIEVLNILKGKLYHAISKIEKEKNKIEEVVQAIIDRTLYIKYLEDNHIINSYFYERYFNSDKVNYKTLLQDRKRKQLNKLFKEIHSIFNNGLFDKPNIEDEFLTDDVCNLIFHSLSGTNFITNQLRLLDFKFEVIPVEFISYIYEIFLSEKQKDNGIYYTPKKLAQLIIDDVIIDNNVGRILDPSCGSGMFLIVAFQKLLDNSKERNYKDIEKRIEHRTKLLSENIFGIEKEITAQRFTIFSLSLQLFRGLDPLKIKEYIANQLKENGKVDLFRKFDLSKNILRENTLDQNKVHFEGQSFDYIVGNPPFFEIKQTDEFQNEISFLNNYKLDVNSKKVKIKDIVGKHQISQCFLLKIKDWSNNNTRFGFVSNSSNFYNDNSKEFQSFFYSHYNIEKIYELSKVKKILFEKAKESVVSVIFSNQIKTKNTIEYYPVDMGIFSEKPFELLIIQEEKIINLSQDQLRSGKVKLRDFLIGNEYAQELLKNLDNNEKLISFLKIIEGSGNLINNGIQIVGKEQLLKEFNISETKWPTLLKPHREKLSKAFKEKYTGVMQSKKFPTPLLEPKSLHNFKILPTTIFLGDISNFQRIRTAAIYTEPKILINRTGKSLIAAYSADKIFYNFDIYSIFLKRISLYYLFTAIINSDTVNYFIDLLYRKRADGSFPKIGYDAIKNIPIPNDLDEDLVKQITKISRDLTDNKYEYDIKVQNKINELIFDLYQLSYLEKQRIRDYFIQKDVVTNTNGELEKYKATLIDSISLYFKDKVDIEFSDKRPNVKIIVAKVYFSKQKINSASADKAAQYFLNEIFEESPTENFLASQEKIYTNDCVYIVKTNQNINWTETKAYEDGQDILKHIR